GLTDHHKPHPLEHANGKLAKRGVVIDHEHRGRHARDRRKRAPGRRAGLARSSLRRRAGATPRSGRPERDRRFVLLAPGSRCAGTRSNQSTPEGGPMAIEVQGQTTEEQLAHLRELFADAPEVGRTAMERVLSELSNQATAKPPEPIVNAGRAGSRLGK